MRILLLSFLILAGCGSDAPGIGFVCDEACELAFNRVTWVQLNESGPVSGQFRVTASGLTERRSFSSSRASDKGAQLTRDDLARLWTRADSPSLAAALKSETLQATCVSLFNTNTRPTHNCLAVSSTRGTFSGCWCGKPPDGPVRDAREQLDALFAKAFPKT